MQNGKLAEAEVICRNILAHAPKDFDTLHMLAVICSEKGEYDESERLFRATISLDPNFPPGFYNYGSLLAKQKKYLAAITQFDKALSLFSNFAPAHCDRGSALKELGRFDEALASLTKAVSLAPNIPMVWYNRRNVYSQKNDYYSALSDYDRALEIDPNYSDAWLGRGNVFYDVKRYDEAFAAYDKALALKPELENAWLGRGNVFYDLKRYDEAFAAYDKALALKPELENAWLGRGNVFYDLKRYDEAIAAYDKALALKPDIVGAEGARLHTKMLICDWVNFDSECAHLITSVRDGKTNTSPFAFLGISSSSDEQLQCANLWVAKKVPPSQKPIWRGEHYRHDRIRIAYVSADFHQHATSYLMAGMFECHDKSRFEITAILIGPDDNSEMRQRLLRSFDHFIDTKGLSDEKIASHIREAEIDI